MELKQLLETLKVDVLDESSMEKLNTLFEAKVSEKVKKAKSELLEKFKAEKTEYFNTIKES